MIQRSSYFRSVPAVLLHGLLALNSLHGLLALVSKTFKKAVGFEDSRQFMIFYELNGKFFSGAATLYQYDGKWLIHSLASSLLSTYKPGRVQKMTQQQVDFVFN